MQRQVFEMSIADGNSKNGQDVKAMNVAAAHGVDLVKITDAMNQQNPVALQEILNKFKMQLGSTDVPTMLAARNVVALEFLKAAVGAGNLNQTLEAEFLKSLPPGATADQTRAVVNSYVDKAQGAAPSS